jgi:dephospho-CoA kinase
MPQEGQAPSVTVHVFGLTGGLASGKGVVAARFKARGVPVINADELSRAAVAKGSQGLRDVVEAFGAGVLTTDGELDRKALGARVFADPEARRRLEGITHPRIQALMREQTRELEQRGEPLVCYEAPILIEVGMAEALRPLVVVASSEENQLARARLRDGLPEDELRGRIAAQLPLAEKVRVADHVIDNDGSIAAAEAEADRVLEAICSSVGVAAERYPRP